MGVRCDDAAAIRHGLSIDVVNNDYYDGISPLNQGKPIKKRKTFSRLEHPMPAYFSASCIVKLADNDRRRTSDIGTGRDDNIKPS